MPSPCPHGSSPLSYRRCSRCRALGLRATLLPLLLLAVGLLAGCDAVSGPAATTSPTVAPTRPPVSVSTAGGSPTAGPAGAPASPSPGASPSPRASASPSATPSPAATATATVAGLASPEASPIVAAPEGWATVNDPNGRWRIDVPQSWRREIRFSHGIFTAPYFDAVTVVRIIPLSEVGGQRDLRQAAREYVEGQGPPLDKVRLEGIDELSDSPAGTSRVQARYSFERRALPWGATAVIDLRGNSIYVIDVSTVKDKASSFSADLQHMIGSLRFTY